MTAIINGDSPSVTFSDSTTQATSAVVSGKVPYSILPAGSVLQVVNATTSTQTTNTTGTVADTTLTATITPKFSTSKILVLVNQNGVGKDSSSTSVGIILQRNGSNIVGFETTSAFTGDTSASRIGSASTCYLDSPATTSATTYKTQFYSYNGTANVYVQLASAVSTITLMEIAV
jgi:hypothetical protein